MLDSFRNSVQICGGAPPDRPELNVDTLLLARPEASGRRTTRPSPKGGLKPRATARGAHSGSQSAVEAELSFSDLGSEEGKIVATATDQDEQFPKGDC
jgi:hypothetical protein